MQLNLIAGYKFAMLEIKTILALILKNYELSTNYEVEFKYRVTLRAKGGILIDMKPRRNVELKT